MDKASQQDRVYWPSLLDRLTSDPRGQDGELGLSLLDLKQAVRENLEHLFSNVRLSFYQDIGSRDDSRDDRRRRGVKASVPLSAYPLTYQSVLNYGIPPVVGRVLTDGSYRDLEDEIRKAVLAYEPRLDGETLSVAIMRNQSDFAHILLEIRGEVVGAVDRVALVFRTSFVAGQAIGRVDVA